MNPDEKDLLEKTYKLSQENNKILKGIRSSNRLATFMRVFYWILIIGVSVGAFYFLQPYIDTLTKTYKTLQTDLNNVKSAVNVIPKSINTTAK
jgi:hypothetical protein